MIVRVALLLLPPDQRDRMAEQWAADLEGAHEVGVPASAIRLAALRCGVDARGRRIHGLIAGAVGATWPVQAGVLLGAACDVAGVSVLPAVVVAVGVGLPVAAARLVRRRSAPPLALPVASR